MTPFQQDVKRLRKEGLSHDQIAKRLGSTKGSVKMTLYRLQFPRGRRGRPYGNGFDIPPAKLDEYKAIMATRKVNAREAGEMLGII